MSLAQVNFDNLKINTPKKKRNEFVLENGEDMSKKKKVKNSVPSSYDSNSNVEFGKFLQYKSNEMYTKIVAKPNLLPSTPKLFQQNQFTNSEQSNYPPTSFLSNVLTLNCFDSDTKNRFSFISQYKQSLNEPQRDQNILDKNNEIDGNKKLQETKNKKIKNNFRVSDNLNSEAESIESGQSGEKITNQVDMYNAVKKKALIFHMHYPCKFSFQGEIKITVILGEVEILGLTLNQSCQFNGTEVYSPNWCTPLIIESNVPKENKQDEEIKSTLSDILINEDIDNLMSKIKPNDSVLLIEQIVSPFGIVINKYFEKTLFPKDLENVSSSSESLKRLQSIFNFTWSKKSKKFKKNLEWDRIPIGQCTVLCGGKGVGKSTLLKYYVNKLVAEGEKVLCLDFDPGQPEFTPPGCLSATIVDKPLLGPNFTHPSDPNIMVYFGNIDVCQGPAKFLECINYVIQLCRKNEELLKLKWIVNTMGFCKGLGIQLMISTLKLLNPNTVIQIKCSEYKNNYPFYLTPMTVNAQKGFRSMTLENISLNFDLRVIYSCAESEKKQLKSGLKPRELREIMTISYFSRMTSPPYYNFNAVQPYLKSFSQIYLGIDFLVPPNDVLKAFNGNTVSLNNFKPDGEEILSPEPDDNEYFKIVVNPSVTCSLGLGFVRGIDCTSKTIYVISHLPMEEMKTVNCLCLGKISPPHCMFLNQDTAEGQLVYTSFGSISSVHRVKKLFRAPPSFTQTNNYDK